MMTRMTTIIVASLASLTAVMTTIIVTSSALGIRDDDGHGDNYDKDKRIRKR